MRTFLFFLLFSTSTLSACTCAFRNDLCSYAAGYFGNSDTSAVLRYAKLIEFRNPEVGANLYDFVVVEHLFGAVVADTVTLWGGDGGSCNGPHWQLNEGDEYLILHSATMGISSYYQHTLENFSNPYPIYDFPGCGPAALPVAGGNISGPLAPEIENYAVEEFREDITDCVMGNLVSIRNGAVPAIDFAVWPNPSAGPLNVSFRQPVFLERVDLVDVTGRVVRSRTDFSGSVRSLPVDAGGLATGVYLLRVQLENGRLGSKRIVVR